MKYVRSRIADESVAEELTQEVFIKAYRAAADYQREYALTTWLWAIARNTITDHLRVLKRAQEANVFFDGATELDELPSADAGAEAHAIRREERQRFFRLARCLTRPQRRVMWLYVVHQLTYEEIAARLGVSLAAVKNLAYRARQALNMPLAAERALA